LEPLVIRRQGFSPCIRYSCLHSHCHRLHHGSRRGFPAGDTLPYPPAHRHPPPRRAGGEAVCAGAAASAVCLSPATLSARDHLTSELLRTLSRMAASKPTSWLSTR